LGYDSGFLPSRSDRASINLPRDPEGNTYLHELCRKDAPLEAIRDAIRNGADVNALNKKNMPPLLPAIQTGKAEVVAALVDAGADICFPVSKVLTFNAVYLAADAGRDAVLKTLLAKGGGVYVNAPGMTQDGRPAALPALHAAIKTYHYDMIEPLVSAGALPNEEAGIEKKTPLMIAIENNTPNAVRRLLNVGADLERRHSETGRTPLVHASAGRNGAAARGLVDCGADVNAADNSGLTPLMLAAENGDNGMTDLLIAAKADVDRRRAGTNETALMKAARKGSSDIIRALLKAGANPTLTDDFNKTALRHADEAYAQGARSVLAEAEQKAMQRDFEDSYRKYRP
jgi:ankyrin repeat protein